MEKTDNVCNPKVFEDVFKKNAESLRNFMYYKCGNMDQAEDFVQESFVKLWDNCSKVIEEKAKSFLFTVANNLFLNNVAHKKVVLKHQKIIKPSITNESPEFILEEKEFLVKLEKAIQDLPEKQREVFLLNRIDKKKYKEIAELLGISTKAVEKRMSQALKTLREKIGKI
ncbi:sigma-70 family RNA polymerase sigma factor [uncultured Tenacibaculum sp.]|uniref:RNA polymerase sigma factor n=1 Tax=uncultured Tenacibaculum sp. TaxID=174713 RepID=UPI00262E384D|nr:sigma-70 family RNA polymerase sigma factor [uncultured Tenacibaculum sp.]